MAQMPTTPYSNLDMGSIGPSIGMDLGYTMADCMEQAMVMAIGIEAFSEGNSGQALVLQNPASFRYRVS
jgi:hypothetical protein